MWEGLPLFRGINEINLDAKGRMVIPTRYRLALEQGNNKLIVTIDTKDPCLLLYPLSEWELLERRIESLPSFNRASRRVQRLLLGHATELELDATGRILLPALLRDYAQIERKIMLVGQGRKFEIWSEAGWHTQRLEWLKEGAQDELLPEELLSLSI